MVKNPQYEEVTIDKLVHGGQGLGTLDDGRKAFVWNALPGERVRLRLTKKKRDFVEGVAETIHNKSQFRVGDGSISDEDLSTRPWAILGDNNAELEAKASIVTELFAREKIALPGFEIKTSGPLTNYRNKMEYCFWADESGLHLAHYKRGTHGKVKIEPQTSTLSNGQINRAATELLLVLNKEGIRGSQLKSVVIRSAQNKPHETSLALFVKDRSFPKLPLPKKSVVYYSDPKSPASVPTKELYRTGDTTLTQTILERKLSYDVLSFFQVNTPIFEVALVDIKTHIKPDLTVVDMYAGVGTIGLNVGVESLTLVEVDPFNVEMAKKNAQNESVEVVEASTEQALSYITGNSCIIVDPPRSGLHKKVTQKLNETLPAQIVYLSCNPATQARDIKLLDRYTVTFFSAYNFFPKTPHIETLAILEPK